MSRSSSLARISLRRASPNSSLTLRSSVRMTSSSTLGILEDLDQAADGFQQLLVFVGELVLLQAGEAVQAHLQDLLRLRFGQLVDC